MARPPLRPPPPMMVVLAATLPAGAGWSYEVKWDAIGRSPFDSGSTASDAVCRER